MNGEMLTELRKLSEQPGTITAQAHRRLSLAAMADVYEALGEINGRVDADHEDITILKTDLGSLRKRSDIREGIIAIGAIIGTILGVRE